MPTNDFKPFATAGGANVSTQAEYLALAALSTGWQSGKASSKEVNKAVRQATFIAAALAQFVSDKGAVDVLDDGNLAGFGTNLIAAMNKTSQPLDATLTALAALVGAANKLPYFNGADTAALTDLTQVGRDIIGKADIAAVLTYLGLKDAAKRPVGTADLDYIPDMRSFQSEVYWQKLPGKIIQFVPIPPHDGDQEINLPIPFPGGITGFAVGAGYQPTSGRITTFAINVGSGPTSKIISRASDNISGGSAVLIGY